MVRRQELLREAGNFASIRDYEKARATGEPLEPAAVAVHRGRRVLRDARRRSRSSSTCSSRSAGSAARSGCTCCSPRSGSRRAGCAASSRTCPTGSGCAPSRAQESRAVLGVPDAYELPPIPGLGYLKPDPTTMLRFKAAYVSGPPTGRVRVRRDEGGKLQGILPFTISEVLKLDVPVDDPEPEPTPVDTGDQQSLLDIAVGHMVGHGPAAHQVWLPPLDVPDTLDQLMPDLAVDPQLGLVSQEWRALGGLVVPLGTVDRPREQRRDTLSVDLSGGAGHLAVVGGPRSGKSTTLRSVVAGMALTTTPQESQFFVLDFGGGTFAGMAGLPHMAGVGTRSEPDVVSRIIAEVPGIVDRREKYFRANGHRLDRDLPVRGGRRAAPTTATATCSWSSTAGARCAPTSTTSSWRSSSSPPAASPSACTSSPRPAGGRTSGPRCATCSAAGSSCGSATPWTPRSTAGSRRWCPQNRPGRGLVSSKLHFLTALPRIDGDPRADDARRRRRRPRPAGHGGVDRAGRTQAAAAAGADHARRRPRPGRRTGHAVGRREGCAPAGRRHQREGAGPGLARPGRRAAPAHPRRRAVRQELDPARPGARDHAHPHAAAGAAGRRRLPARAARRGPRRVPPQLPHLRHPGPARAARPRDVPREPHPRPRRHPRAAAQPLVVERRRGVRPRRRLRPGRHPAELAGRGAAAAARRRPATSACT